jgi:hypothetical protein
MVEVLIPVPPYALLIILACQVPVPIVPTVLNDDADVKLLRVSKALSMVASVVASIASTPFNVHVPPLSEITLVDPTVRSPPPIVKSPLNDSSLLMVVVPVDAPIDTEVAWPPMSRSVTPVLNSLAEVWFDVISPPLTCMSADNVRSLVTDSVPPSVVAPEATFNVPAFWISIPSPFLSWKSPVASLLPLPPLIAILPVSVKPCLNQLVPFQYHHRYCPLVVV